MAFEAGPLPLVPLDVVPRPGDRRVFEGLVGQYGGELGRAADAIDARAGQAAAGGGDLLGSGFALALADAARAVADPPRAASSSIGDVVGAIDAIEGELTGWIGDVSRDLHTDVPGEPELPPDWTERPGGTEPGPTPSGAMARLRARLRTWFRVHVRREPSAAEYAELTDLIASVGPEIAEATFDDWVEATFGGLRGSGPTTFGPGPGGGSGGAPTPTPAPGSPAADLLERYLQRNPSERPRVEAFLAGNRGDEHRAPAALDLPGWDEFVRSQSR